MKRETLYNPFAAALKDSKSPIIQRAGELLLTYRGHEVYKPFDKCFNFSKDGVIWTQRAGFSVERAKIQIDDFEDGTDKSKQGSYHAFEHAREYHAKGMEATA